MKKIYIPGADILRILAGFGVVLIHVTDPFLMYPPYFGTAGSSWWIVNVINASFRFSVPAFIMISGFLLLDPDRKDSFETFYKKRFARVGIPFLFWLVMYFIWIKILGFTVTPFTIFTSLISVNLQHLYFLYIIIELYFISPLFIVFNRGTGPKAHKIFAITTSLFTLLVASSGYFLEDAYVPLVKNVFTIFLPFISYFYLGYYLRNAKFSGLQSIWAINIFLNLVLVTTLLSNGDITSFVRQYGSPTVFAMSVIVFVLLLRNKIWDRLLPYKKLISAMKHLSGTMFGIYLVHMLVISWLDLTFSIDPGDIGSPMWLYVVAKVFIVFGLSYLIVVLGKKIPKLGILFG